MKRVAIVIGHGPRIDEGAENKDGTTELDWNQDLAHRILRDITEPSIRLHGVVVHRVTEKLQPVTETNETRADMAIELHLNSTPGASGTEMIHYPGSARGMKLASLLQAAAVRVLGLPNRGIKTPQGGGRGLRWLKNTNMPAVIVESFFIDNDGDLSVGNEKKDELAKAYADALVEFANL